MLDDRLATVASKAMQIKHIYILTRMYSFEQRNLESENFFISSGMLFQTNAPEYDKLFLNKLINQTDRQTNTFI